jgi:hypothetical protein
MMIRADVRSLLGRDDAQLALRLIARGSNMDYETMEGRLREEGIDALLDDPRLLAALVKSGQGAHASFPLFSYVVVRHALRAAGESDIALADFVASILLHFGVRDVANRISRGDDQTYDTLAELSGDVDDPDARRAFLVRAHLGNYALWLSGLFPDRIEHRRWRRGGPALEYFEEMGRRGYQLAADHRMSAQLGLTALFALAAERFALLRVALNNVSDVLFFPNVHTPDRLLRQVRDEARWRRIS